METTINENELRPIVKELLIELLQDNDLLDEILEDLVLIKEMDKRKMKTM